MILLKWISLILVFIITFYIGLLISKKYRSRVEELKEMKNALNIFETKIKFTYEPIPDIFKEISNITSNKISGIFKKASEYMECQTAGEAWEESLNNCNTNMNSEDIGILKKLSQLLGKTDIDGQLSEIQLTSNFLDYQIKNAEIESEKNEKMYKTLGAILGLALLIILV